MDLRDPRVRYLSVAIVLLVVGAIGAVLLLGPGREARQDLDEMETDLTSQLEVTREMIELMHAMLTEMRELNDKMPPPTGGELGPQP